MGLCPSTRNQNIQKTCHKTSRLQKCVCSPPCVSHNVLGPGTDILPVPLEIEFSQIWLWCCWFSPTTHGEESWVMMPPADKQRKDTSELYMQLLYDISSKRWALHPCQNNLKLLSSFTSTKTLLCRIPDVFQKKNALKCYSLAPE